MATRWLTELVWRARGVKSAILQSRRPHHQCKNVVGAGGSGAEEVDGSETLECDFFYVYLQCCSVVRNLPLKTISSSFAQYGTA
jgi:hypothetical protein